MKSFQFKRLREVDFNTNRKKSKSLATSHFVSSHYFDMTLHLCNFKKLDYVDPEDFNLFIELIMDLVIGEYLCSGVFEPNKIYTECVHLERRSTKIGCIPFHVGEIIKDELNILGWKIDN